VSRLFETHLGSSYLPEKHWTSPLRSKANLPPYEKEKDDTSTFTISDEDGAFKGFLRKFGYRKAANWRSHQDFHIEVVTTGSGLDDLFWFNGMQILKVRVDPPMVETIRKSRERYLNC
jgi:hypothetical protein